jgi:hypothetical protein
MTRVFKEQGIMPQHGGQPLHPIQFCKSTGSIIYLDKI